MFDLEEAIAAWRESASASVDPDKLEELESHLRDDIAAREESGLPVEEAFVLAHHRLGDLGMLEREFAKDEGGRVTEPRRRMPKWAAYLAAAAACWAVMAAWIGIDQYFFNDTYTSTAKFEVMPLRLGANVPIFDDKSAQYSSNSVDMATELEIVQSAGCILAAVDELRLAEHWRVSRDQAYRRVCRMTTVNQLGKSNIIALKVVGNDAELARNLAAAQITSYKDRKESIWSGRHGNELDMLNKNLKDQNDRVEESRLRMLDLAHRYRITPESKRIVSDSELEAATAVRKAKEEMAGKSADGSLRDQDALRLQVLEEILESAQNDAFDYHRNIAEYDEAAKDYELQRTMLADMQETFAKVRVILTMPQYPVAVHEDAMIAEYPDTLDGWAIFWRSLRGGWPLILLGGCVGVLINGMAPRQKIVHEPMAASFPLWKHGAVMVAILAAACVITPTPDALTASILSMPLIGMYLAGVFLVTRSRRHRAWS